MWIIQVAILSLAVYEIKNFCVSCVTSSAIHEQFQTNFKWTTSVYPLLPLVMGQYIILQLFTRKLPWIAAYYLGFTWFLIFHGWILTLYYYPVFVAHYVALNMLASPYILCSLSVLLLNLCNFWWVVSFAFGLHVTFISAYMFYVGNPSYRTHESFGYYAHIALGKYFYYSTSLWSTVSKYNLF